MGLAENTIGSFCVTTDADADGAWTGGMTIYKPDTRNGAPAFGEAFDYTLYYPFLNAKTGTSSVPLNTFQLGTSPEALVANWLSIFDVNTSDGLGITGVVNYYNSEGELANSQNVFIPNGGRGDLPGHQGLVGDTVEQAIGTAVFVPDALPNGGYAAYNITATRYFYDCPGASCTNFLTAFNVPFRPDTKGEMVGSASTVDGRISVVELTNSSTVEAQVVVRFVGEAGNTIAEVGGTVPARGKRDIIANAFGGSGFVPDNTVAYARVQQVDGNTVSASGYYYQRDEFGNLTEGYSAPFAASPGTKTISQFNSFIEHQNTLEVYNTNVAGVTTTINFIDFNGNSVFSQNVTIAGNAMLRLANVELPDDSYGVINVEGDVQGLVIQNITRRVGQYSFVTPGQ
jgi:hypothetical protein